MHRANFQMHEIRAKSAASAARTPSSAALVAAATRRAGFVREIGSGGGGEGAGQNAGGARPVCSIPRQAARSAASSGQRVTSSPNLSRALKMLRP